LKLVLSASALTNDALVRLAFWKLAPLTSAPMKSADSSFVVDPGNWAFVSCAWTNEAPVASAPPNVAPVRFARSNVVACSAALSKCVPARSGGNPVKRAPARWIPCSAAPYSASAFPAVTTMTVSE
jgi:hypothetical protein